MKMKVKDKKFKGTNIWTKTFCKRYGISIQKKINNKSKSIEGRLAKNKNLHWYVQYQMALEEP